MPRNQPGNVTVCAHCGYGRVAGRPYAPVGLSTAVMNRLRRGA